MKPPSDHFCYIRSLGGFICKAIFRNIYSILYLSNLVPAVLIVLVFLIVFIAVILFVVAIIAVLIAIVIAGIVLIISVVFVIAIVLVVHFRITSLTLLLGHMEDHIRRY